MSVKIMALEAENVKRIKAVALTPSPTGLTLVGGNNNQGKTSVLDALACIQVQCHLRPQQHRAARRLLCARLAPRGLRKEVLTYENH